MNSLLSVSLVFRLQPGHELTVPSVIVTNVVSLVSMYARGICASLLCF